MRKPSIDLYHEWLSQPVLEENERTELLQITADTAQIEDRFYCDLAFGTAGMRGVCGMGTNRMNRYTVRRAAAGLAQHIASEGGQNAGVVISRDIRRFSDIFARETAKVMVAAGIKVYFFESPHAVPEISFAVRRLGAAAGVMITASHNPREYNGFKAYGPDGGQLAMAASDRVVAAIQSLDMFGHTEMISDDELGQNPLFEMIGEAADQAFLDTVASHSINPEIITQTADDFSLVYTPFHGTGLRPVTAILDRIGVKNLIVEPHQAVADPDFSTVKSPNPEDMEGFALATELARRHNASLIVGTDPDADRVGVVVRDASGKYRTLSGNQTGALLCEYVLSAKQAKGVLTPRSAIIKSVVTTELIDAIAKAYNVTLFNVLTGFKFFADRIAKFEHEQSFTYEFGFEESYGYLPFPYVRDKDAVSTVMLICEMAASYHARGMTLYDGLIALYEKYGYYAEKTIPIVLPGKDGMERIAHIMQSTRENMPDEFGSIKIVRKQDFLENREYLSDGSSVALGDYPKSNVLKFYMADEATFVAIRPSGTEPKVKLYFSTAAGSMDKAEGQLNYIMGAVRSRFGL